MRVPATHSPGARRAGFTFAELVVVMVVMLISVSIFTSTVVTTARQRAINRENAIAANAARSALELMRNEEFEQVFALFNADPADDPAGPGTAPGEFFAVEGLNVVDGAPGGAAGRITFPAVDVSGGVGTPAWQLREDFEDPDMGMPRDLNGDGVTDDQDHAGDYVILPVRVTIQWTGMAGQREYRSFTMLVRFLT